MLLYKLDVLQSKLERLTFLMDRNSIHSKNDGCELCRSRYVLCNEDSLGHEVKYTTMSIKDYCKTCVAEDQGVYVSKRYVSSTKSIKQRRSMVSGNYVENKSLTNELLHGVKDGIKAQFREKAREVVTSAGAKLTDAFIFGD